MGRRWLGRERTEEHFLPKMRERFPSPLRHQVLGRAREKKTESLPAAIKLSDKVYKEIHQLGTGDVGSASLMTLNSAGTGIDGRR